MSDAAPPWRERRVLVTGSTGFLGRWLTARLLREGARVTALSRRSPAGERAPRSRGDGVHGAMEEVHARLDEVERVSAVIADGGIDTVFHLAAQPLSSTAQREPWTTLETNVRGTWCVLEAVRRAGRDTGVVLASTDAVYGDGAPPAFTEASPCLGASLYAVSKIGAERIVRGYAHNYGIPVAVARMSALYGGGDLNFERIIPGTIRSVLRGETPVIRSDGSPEREYLYVEDAVDGFLRLGEALASSATDADDGTFNLTAEDSRSVLDIVRAVLARAGRDDMEPQVLGRRGERVSRVHTSAARAREVLGWRAATPLEAGLDTTIRWYREHTVEAGT